VRVVYVASFPRGGTVTHVQTLAPSVAATGTDVHVICATEWLARRFRETGVAATPLELRHKLDLGNAARMRKLLRSADVVHIHDRRAGLLVRPFARALGAAVVETYHGVPEALAPEVGRTVPPERIQPRLRVLRSRGYLKLEGALARLGLVIVPSQALADYLLRRGFPASRLRVVPYAIDLRRGEPGPANEPPVVATSAYLIERKGVDVLLEARALMTTAVRLEIFGDGELRGELEQQAAALAVDVRFHGEVDDVRSRLEDADIFVLSTRGDNLPVAILEAMAAALPVAASRVGGVPELVLDGETGLLVEPDDPKALAGALDALVADPDRRRLLGQQGARRVAEHFEAGAIARRVVAIYAEAVARTAAVGAV
jgi:glycosyltransferase involved in cell wall biosynthesis